MTIYVLAGDIGGTKTNLALYAVEEPQRVVLVREASFPSADYDGLEGVIDDFRQAGQESIAAGAFGIAGPVLDGKVVATNLPWEVETPNLRKILDGGQVRLMNDLETTAYGALFLADEEIHILNAGNPRCGNCAVIAAGTGLGQAFLFWDGQRYIPTATEGGHVDFSPRDEKEVELLHFLKKQYNGRVSYERVLSGPGLVGIFQFLDQGLNRSTRAEIRARMQAEDPAAVIGEAGVSGTCGVCTEAVDMFVSLYGAQAGNLALTVMSVGGVYIGGGIVTKMLSKMTSGLFMDAFVDKGRFAQLLRDMPVRIILNPKAAQVGAAHAARELLS
jgi:glucokinase